MASINNNGRRNFIRKASLGGIISLNIPQIINEVFAAEKAKKIALKKEDIILFQGDSITDAGRKKEEEKYNNAASLGTGYAFLAASELLYHHADKGLKIYNKGISGNKVFQLAERWDADCLDIKPNVLSILIGVNDHWHTKRNGYTGTLKTYQDDYQTLLDRTKQKLPDVKLIIGEPFGVSGIPGNYEKWDPVFDDFRKTAREIATRFDAVLIPYQAVFDKAQKSAPGVYWTGDGVHTTLAGAKLMAQAWLEAIKS